MIALMKPAGRCAIACLAACALVIAVISGTPSVALAQAQSKSAPQKAPAKKGSAPKVLSAQSEPGANRKPFTQLDETAAVVLGIADARAWGDSEEDFVRLLPKASGPWLAMSGGGSDGSYAGGLITGLTQSGKRPEYAVVSGASIGALIGPFAFVGPRYDEKLRDQFTNLIAGDIFEDRPTGQSLMDSWPLKRTIEKQVTRELLADVAAEHKRGRRLWVVTTNLDAGRRMIWNMGAIAERGDDKALKLFRDILLASASIPGMFPPVVIEAEAGGRTIQELHNDGSITSPFFLAPETVLAGTGTVRLPTDQLFVIANAKLTPQFDLVSPQTAVLLGRSIGLALQYGLRAEILLTVTAAQRLGLTLHVAHIPTEFEHPARGAFDPDYMRALFDFGAEQAKKGNGFETVSDPDRARTNNAR
jgi:hypothetical protein